MLLQHVCGNLLKTIYFTTVHDIRTYGWPKHSPWVPGSNACSFGARRVQSPRKPGAAVLTTSPQFSWLCTEG